jgi:TolB protein
VYQVASGNQAYPYILLRGQTDGLDWKTVNIPSRLLENQQQVSSSPTPLTSIGRLSLVTLNDVSAPTPKLISITEGAFQALRQQVISETGWDFLASLENAFVPLTQPADPGLQDDWLYTGRAFAVTTQPLNAGWMFLTREDFNGQTYWRVYLKTRFQDGSQGQPFHVLPWDLSARSSGDTQAYEQGGKIGVEPDGYWVDFTELAARFGWERLPSLMNWRNYYPAIRYNVFVLKDGLDWKSAMAQIYPPEALVTATNVPSATLTASATSRWIKPKTPTPTRTPTATATFHPTWTQLAATSTP